MSNHRKVCILSTVHPVDDVRVYHKEVRSLCEAGYDVVLVALPAQGKLKADFCCRVLIADSAANKLARIFVAPWKVFWLGLKQGAEIYHFHDPELIPVGLLLKLFGKKVIYDVHEDYSESILSKHYIHIWLRKIISLFFVCIEKAAAPLFDLVVVATEHIGNSFSGCNIVAIHNYPLSQVNPAHTDNVHKFRIIYPGPIAEIRGITNLMKAVGSLRVPDVELVLIGDFVPLSYKDQLSKCSGWNNTVCLGTLSHSEVIKELANATVGVECSLPVPNYLYAESNKIFEYMSVGIPVVCSNLPRIKEIVEGSECGICVNPENIGEIIQALTRLYERPDLRDKMGENGRNAIAGKYNWSLEGEKLVAAYKRVLGNN